MKIWNLVKYSKEVFNNCLDKFNMPVAFAKILAGRPYFSDLILNDGFCKNEFSCFEDFFLLDIDKAAERIEKALKNDEKICIFGDYDADGVTSTAMLYLYLKNRGGTVDYYIPDRNVEGYGLNLEAIKKIKEQGTNLIITVDNGVTALKEIDFANSLSLDVVVTDHHKVPDVLPNALAIVDPHRPDCPSKFKELAGVGVVFSLILFMEKDKESIESSLGKYSLLAMIGTIGDVVPLISFNRSLISFGLKAIKDNPSIGIKALLKKNSKSKYRRLRKNMTAFDVSFNIVPRINAVGRKKKKKKAVDLLVTQDLEKAKELATELDNINKKRKEIVEDVFVCIDPITCVDTEKMYQKILIFYGENWSAGVIGIVAARLLDQYHKPVIVITKMGNIARGSARSVPGFSIYDALLKSCSSYLLRFGGHPLAAGFDIDISNIERLKKDILTYADSEDIPPLSLNLDAEIEAEEITSRFAKYIKKLEPFGKSNEKPLFKIEKVRLKNICVVGEGKHLKINFYSKKGRVFYVLKFFTNTKNFCYKEGDLLDLAVNIEDNIYNGRQEFTTVLIDAKFSNLDENEIFKQRRIYENIMLRKYSLIENFKKEDIIPKREDFVTVYKYLKFMSSKFFDDGAIKGETSVIYYRMGSESISFSKFLLILEIFCELGIIEFFLKADSCSIQLKNTTNKVDLESSKILGGICKEE